MRIRTATTIPLFAPLTNTIVFGPFGGDPFPAGFTDVPESSTITGARLVRRHRQQDSAETYSNTGAIGSWDAMQ